MNTDNLKNCRSCGSDKLVTVLNLGNHPYSGYFPKKSEENLSFAPLKLIKCVDSNNSCNLVQLGHRLNSADFYNENYGYRSGLNAQMVNHLAENIKFAEKLVELEDDDLVLDIGSNDGTSLKQYSKEKLTKVGVDPTAHNFKRFYDEKSILIPEFYSYDTVKEVIKKFDKKFKVITSFSMFYDLENPVEFAKNIYHALDDNGIWVLEQSDLLLMLQNNSFDTICHEHLEYYSFSSLLFIFRECNFKVIDVNENFTNGGSLRIVVAKNESSFVFNDEITDHYLKREEKANLNTTQIWNDFEASILKQKEKFFEFVDECKKQGQVVYGLGASTKGNTLLNYYQISQEIIKKIGDVNELKHGKMTPLSNIPIISEMQSLDDRADYYVILPWHFEKHFLNEEKYKGFNLVFPLPNFRIIKSYER